MIKLSISILTLVLVGCAQASLTLQQKSGSPPAPPPVEARPAREVGKARAYYSASRDETEVIVQIDLVSKRNSDGTNEGLSMLAHFTVRGQKVVRPEAIRLGFESYSKGLRYKDNHKLVIVLDNVPLVSSETRLTSSDVDSRGLALETLISPALPFGQFTQILGAKRIQILLGDTKIELKPEQLQALRDLQRIIEQ